MLRAISSQWLAR